MDRKGVTIIAASILAGALILGLSQAWAQHSFRTDSRASDGAASRYVVVNVADGEIIIMDTTSGDLYSAKPKDVKPYETRWRPRTFTSSSGSSTVTTTTGRPFYYGTTTTGRFPTTTERPTFKKTTTTD